MGGCLGEFVFWLLPTRQRFDINQSIISCFGGRLVEKQRVKQPQLWSDSGAANRARNPVVSSIA